MKNGRFKSKMVTVVLTKSAQYAPRLVVPAHELPILELIHGDETVMVVKDTKTSKKQGAGEVREFNHDRERERLTAKYKPRAKATHPVEVIYGPKQRSTLGIGTDELSRRRMRGQDAPAGDDTEKTGTED